MWETNLEETWHTMKNPDFLTDGYFIHIIYAIYFTILPWFLFCYFALIALTKMYERASYWDFRYDKHVHYAPLFLTWFNFNPGMDK